MNQTLSPQIHIPKSIALVGMMGAGKTSVGQKLAFILGLPFFDSDLVLEQEQGLTVANYFATHGENAFRKAEEKTIATLLAGPKAVLSLGGGAYISVETRKKLRVGAITVWLKADLETLLHRAMRQGKRPLLETSDPRQTMKMILSAREAIYAEADLIIESDNRPVALTAERVQKALEVKLKAMAK